MKASMQASIVSCSDQGMAMKTASGCIAGSARRRLRDRRRAPLRVIDGGVAAQEGDVDDGEADIPGLMPRDEGHHVLLAPDQEDALGGDAPGLARHRNGAHDADERASAIRECR
jgi:hypothetical protein